MSHLVGYDRCQNLLLAESLDDYVGLGSSRRLSMGSISRPQGSLVSSRRRPGIRMENEAVLDRMQARLSKRPEVLDQRREAVEHPFGTIKQWMNQGAFL